MRRVVSTYHHQRATGKWADYPERMPLKMMKRLVEEDHLANAIANGVPGTWQQSHHITSHHITSHHITRLVVQV